MPLTQVSPGLLDTNAQYYGFKNRIINGGMGVWQRGTSFSNTTAGGSFYTADRWGCNRSGDVAGITISRSTSVPSGFQYSLALQRTAGNTSAAALAIYNSNESVNTLDLAGQDITFSFYARTGTTYSGGALTINVLSGTGTDQRVYAYTGSSTIISTTQAISTTWARYSFTGSVSSSATELGFSISWVPSGTAGADDTVYFTGFQLEKGSTATSFDYRPYGTELMLCQRYYYRATGLASIATMPRQTPVQAWSTTATSNGYLSAPVSMRTGPTFASSGMILRSPNYGSFTATFAAYSATADGVNFQTSGSTGLTLGAIYFMAPNTGTADYYELSAEL